MLERTLKLENRLGLHARAAAKVVRLAQGFASSIVLTDINGGRSADATSILDLLTLAAACGNTLTLQATGPDEAEAVREMEKLFESKFDEA